MKNNPQSKHLWGTEDPPDLEEIFKSCLGYASTPGWSVLYQEVLKAYQGFNDLNVVELGCGLGKVSLLASLLGANTTLIDYSEKQLKAAEYLHHYFGQRPHIIEEDILRLPNTIMGRYDIAFSFGTAEHFWAADRQRVFDSHAGVLKKGGLSFIWVPNKWGVLFHLGRTLRKVMRRGVCPVDESSFTRRELLGRAQDAGLENLKVCGGERLINDFHNFIMKLSCLEPGYSASVCRDCEQTKKILVKRATTNSARISPLNNHFSYPLLLVGTKA